MSFIVIYIHQRVYAFLEICFFELVINISISDKLVVAYV